MPAPIADLPHYPEGVAFLAARRRAGLFDGMGMIKSHQTIGALDEIGAQTALWICPAVTRRHIEREFGTWSSDRTVQTIENGSEKVAGDVIVVSYELAVARPIWLQLMRLKWAVLVLDEAQYLRTRTTRRTVGIYGRNCSGVNCLLERAERCWILSGTICPNHLGEIWTHYRALFDGPLEYWQFLQRYTVSIETPWGPKPVRNQNTSEFRSFIEPHVLRRRAERVPGMPALLTSLITVDPGKADLRELEREFPGLRAAAAAGDDEAILALLERASGGHLARLARVTGEAKVGAALELLREELQADPGHQVIVGFWHRAVGHALHAGLVEFESRIIDGSTSPRARQQAIDEFQARRSRVICLQIAAGGIGIDLTAAGHVLLAEASWNPASNAQLLARAVRPTQARPLVFGRYLALAGSLDEGIQRALERKARLLAEIREIAA
jgi:SNF2 family DNA or RNA helicase